jgi:hypothetical protein
VIRKLLVASVLATGSALLVSSPADAWGWHGGWGWHGCWWGGGVAAGVAVGTAVGVARARPAYVAPAPVYVPPPGTIYVMTKFTKTSDFGKQADHHGCRVSADEDAANRGGLRSPLPPTRPVMAPAIHQARPRAHPSFARNSNSPRLPTITIRTEASLHP